MAQKKSVDEFWKELNARPAPRMAAAGGIGNLPGITSITRTVPKVVPAQPAEEDVVLNASREAARKAAASYDPAKAGVTADDLSSYTASMQRTINCLSDQDRSTRRQAACTLQTKIMKGDAATPAASASMLQALVCGPLLVPLVNMLQDVVEKCRVIAVEMLVHAARTITDLSPLLPVLMPELLKRMGHLPVVEPAEEIRLGLAQLVAAVVERSDLKRLAPYTGDLCTFLCRALEDGYHEIKKVACVCVADLAVSVPPQELAQHSEKLLATLLANLGHQHAKVRAAVIDALVGLVGLAALPAGAVSQTVAPTLRPYAYDRMPAVRTSLFDMLAFWLGKKGLPQGVGSRAAQLMTEVDPGLAYSYAPDLLPVLLVGVNDPQPSVAEAVLNQVENVGEVWCEHQARTRSKEAGGDTDMVDSAGAAAASAGGAEGGASGAGDAECAAAVQACQLGAPYKGRPGAGARAMVRGLLPILLPPIIKELTEWLVAQRVCAARSLHTILVFAEDAATEHLASLLPALCSSVGDEDVEVAGFVVRSVHIVGAHVPARRWLPLIVDQLSNAKLSAAQRANTLVVMSGLLHTAGRAQQQLTPDLLQTLAGALVSDEVRGAADHAPTRHQLLSVAVNTMGWAGAQCGGISQQLCTLLLLLLGHEKDAEKKAAITAAMQQLAASCGAQGWEAVVEQHAGQVLAAVIADASRWTAESSSFLVLKALLLTSGPPTLSSLMPPVYTLVKAMMGDHEGDAPLRMAVLQLMDELMEDPVRGPAVAGEHAPQLLSDVLLPPLQWRAGKTAAAVRFHAVTALATLLRRQLVKRKPVLNLVDDGTLWPIIAQELDEDWYVDVRSAAAYVAEQLLLLVGPHLNHEHRRAIYPELLKRLDDSNNQVRIGACRALVAFCTTLGLDYCETNAGYLAAGAIIHMDDSDQSVQEATCLVMEALAAKKPDAVKAEVLKVKDRFRSKHYCDRVLAACVPVAAAGGGGAAAAPTGLSLQDMELDA